MDGDTGRLREAALATAKALRDESAVARIQAEAAWGRARALRAVAEAYRREAELTADEPGGLFRRRHADLAERHAQISEKEASNHEAEAARGEAEAATADARAAKLSSSRGEGGLVPPPS
jgi:hypothetical protein